MAKSATTIQLTPEEERVIRSWITEAEQQQERAERARIILLAARGWSTQKIASAIGGRPSRVSKWRIRFANAGIAGLENRARTGRPRSYDSNVEARILALAAQPPPEPLLSWTGPLLARSIGTVTVDYVWKVLRTHGVSLRRQDPRDLETAPLSPLNLAGITGLYLARESCAFLVHIGVVEDEARVVAMRSSVRAPSIRVAAALRLRWRPDTRLVEAIQVVTAAMETGSYASPSTRSLQDFLLDAQTRWPRAEIHGFVLSRRPPDVSSANLHCMPTFEKWTDRLASFLEVFPPSVEKDSAGSGGQLLLAIEKLVSLYSRTQGAAFEWQSWPCA